jgi:GT2 family glycosyltransferase
MTVPAVWIVVLHWKELELTRRCLKTLQELDYPNYTIVVVDNNSDDGSLECIRGEFPAIPTLGLSANVGFAGGVNAGIRYARAGGADYIVLLNNDTEMPAGLLRNLVEHAEAMPRLGILTPKVVWQDEPRRLYGLGGRRLPFRVKLRGMGQWDRGPWSGPPILLDFVFGCCMLIKSEVFEQIGLFDERFFMYFEDIDFCYRAADAGWTIGYLPEAVLPHIGAASTRRSGMREFLIGRSRQLFFRKHVFGLWWLIYIPYELFYTARYLLRLIGQGYLRPTALYIGGTLAGLVADGASK